MPDHDLTSLGSRAFEQMIVSLALAELGPGLSVFGDGPDGGREATCDMPIEWSRTAVPGQDSATWRGRTVVQAKYNVKPDPAPLANATWLQYEIGKELKSWVKAKVEGTRDWFPDQIIFVTNVDLSPVAKSGGLDLVDKYIRKRIDEGSDAAKAGLRIRDYRIWHADQVRAMIDAHQSVRWAYPALLSVGDLLSLLGGDHFDDQLGTLNLDDPIREELLRSLKADQWIRLGQAGAAGDEKLRLHDIVIDVPAIIEDETGDSTPGTRVVAEVLKLGDANLSRREPDPERAPFVVVVGGPGQGKSTVSQLIAQAYRAALLAGANVGPDARIIVESTAEALARNGLTLPYNRRWPARVDLAKYAEELMTGTDLTLLAWIAAQASKHIEANLTASNLRSWLRVWPWALILDGLDEVPTYEARASLRRQIDDLVATAEDIGADLLIVVTTRPTGDEEFPADTYRHLRLTTLAPDDVATFSKQLVDRRFADDPEMQMLVSERLNNASVDPSTRRIMQTPLQVTIMSVIVEKTPHLPPDRFTLFDLYYDTILGRESRKDIPVARFLVQNRLEIDRLHETVGLRLQVVSEGAEAADAILDVSELRELATEQMTLRGFDHAKARDASELLVDAAMTRLVLLVPQDDGIGFEVRSLGELMAAKAIARGDDNAVARRLEAIARHPHWGNTWLFAIGKLLSSDQRFERLIVGLLRRMDTEVDWLPTVLPTAPGRAAAILGDNLADQRPFFERALIQEALRELQAPPSRRTLEIAGGSGVVRGVLASDHWNVAVERLRALMGGDAQCRASALTLVETLISHGPVAHQGRLNEVVGLARFEQWEIDAVESWLKVAHGREVKASGTLRRLDELLCDAIATVDSALASDPRVALALNGLRSPVFEVTATDPPGLNAVSLEWAEPEGFVAALDDPDLAVVIDAALRNVAPNQWPMLTMLGLAVGSAMNRRAVGDDLWASIQADLSQDSKY